MSTLDSIRQRAEDPAHPVHWDAQDRDRLLATLDAALALAGQLEAEAVAAENVRSELMKAPRMNGLRQEIYAYAQASSTSRNHAARIRAAVNDALEAGK